MSAALEMLGALDPTILRAVLIEAGMPPEAFASAPPAQGQDHGEWGGARAQVKTIVEADGVAAGQGQDPVTAILGEWDEYAQHWAQEYARLKDPEAKARVGAFSKCAKDLRKALAQGLVIPAKAVREVLRLLDTAYPAIAGHVIAIQQVGETVAHGQWAATARQVYDAANLLRAALLPPSPQQQAEQPKPGHWFTLRDEWDQVMRDRDGYVLRQWCDDPACPHNRAQQQKGDAVP